jgi:hypothetical protein
MRWDNLFDDLESQLEHELTAEEIDLQAEEERLRLARMSLRERILSLHESRTAAGSLPVRLQLTGGAAIAVRPLSFGKDWFSAELVEESQRHSQCIIPLGAIEGLVLNREQVRSSLATSAAPDSGRGLSARLGLAFVLRDLCRRRRAIEVHLADGVVHGTIDRVGRDHFDLAVHEPGSPRRENEVTHYRVIPLSAVQFVRM